MDNQEMNTTQTAPAANQEILVKNALDGWNSQISRTDQLFNILTDEQLQNEVAPGRNTGIYLLGHLAAVHDAMIPLLGLGEKHYTGMDEIFLKNPDKSGLEKPSIEFLRTFWKEVNTSLAAKFSTMQPNEWFERHTSVSPEDF